MSTQDLLHPVYHLGKLKISNNVPLSLLEELFKTKGLKENTFNVYSLVDANKEIITVFDYPIGMTHEEYKTFISSVQKDLDILTNYFSEKQIIEILKSAS